MLLAQHMGSVSTCTHVGSVRRQHGGPVLPPTAYGRRGGKRAKPSWAPGALGPVGHRRRPPRGAQPHDGVSVHHSANGFEPVRKLRRLVMKCCPGGHGRASSKASATSCRSAAQRMPARTPPLALGVFIISEIFRLQDFQ